MSSPPGSLLGDGCVSSGSAQNRSISRRARVPDLVPSSRPLVRRDLSAGPEADHHGRLRVGVDGQGAGEPRLGGRQPLRAEGLGILLGERGEAGASDRRCHARFVAYDVPSIGRLQGIVMARLYLATLQAAERDAFKILDRQKASSTSYGPAPPARTGPRYAASTTRASSASRSCTSPSAVSRVSTSLSMQTPARCDGPVVRIVGYARVSTGRRHARAGARCVTDGRSCIRDTIKNA